MRNKPGRRCSVCVHPAKEYIDIELVNGTPYREIVKKFSGNLTLAPLSRHKKLHIPKQLIKAQEAEEISKADRLLNELKRINGYANKLTEACDRELTDPEDPEKYDIGPRADDINVIYLEPDEKGKPQRKKANLSYLIYKLESNKILPIHYSWRIADPRELILKARNALRDDLELLARMWGEIKEVHVIVDIKQFAVDTGTFWSPRYPEEYKEFVNYLEGKYPGIYN